MCSFPLNPTYNLVKHCEILSLGGLLVRSPLTFINVRGRRACEVEDLW